MSLSQTHVSAMPQEPYWGSHTCQSLLVPCDLEPPLEAIEPALFGILHLLRHCVGGLQVAFSHERVLTPRL